RARSNGRALTTNENWRRVSMLSIINRGARFHRELFSLHHGRAVHHGAVGRRSGPPVDPQEPDRPIEDASVTSPETSGSETLWRWRVAELQQRLVVLKHTSPGFDVRLDLHRRLLRLRHEAVQLSGP